MVCVGLFCGVRRALLRCVMGLLEKGTMYGSSGVAALIEGLLCADRLLCTDISRHPVLQYIAVCYSVLQCRSEGLLCADGE